MIEKIKIDDSSGDRKYFTVIPNYVLNHSSHWDREVYLQMKRIAGETGSCWVSIRKLAKQCGLSKNRMLKSIDYLLEHHWIESLGRKPVTTPGGIQSTNEYRIIDLWALNTNFYAKGGSSEGPPIGQGGSQHDTKVVHRMTSNKNHSYKEEPYTAAGDVPSRSVKTWNLEETLLDMEKTPGSFDDIIATFIREKELSVENSKQLSAVYGRYGRVAKQIVGYSPDRILSSIDRIKRDNDTRQRNNQQPIDWTLETVLKFLTK